MKQQEPLMLIDYLRVEGTPLIVKTFPDMIGNELPPYSYATRIDTDYNSPIPRRAKDGVSQIIAGIVLARKKSKATARKAHNSVVRRLREGRYELKPDTFVVRLKRN